MTAYREHALIALITLCLLSVNSHWGLPNASRLALIGGPERLQANLPAIERAKTMAKKIGTDNLSYADRIHFSVREFLISPFAGDDNFTLNAIRNLNPFKLKFDPHFYMYGGGFIYTGAVFIQFASWIFGIPLISDAQFYLQHPEALGQIFGALRTMVAVFASLGLALAYGITRHFYTPAIARITWGILITMPVVHQASRTVEPHIFVLPFFLLAFHFSVRFAQSPEPRNCYFAAMFTGLSVGTQAISGYVGLAFLSALLIHVREKRFTRWRAFRYLILYSAIAGLVGLMINPFYVLNLEGFMADLHRGSGNQLFNQWKPWAANQLTLFLILLFVTALAYHIIRSAKDTFTKLALPCLLASIPIYIVISNYHMPYIATAMPLFAVFAARMLREETAALRKPMQTIAIATLILLFSAFPAARSAYYIRNFTSENRETAGAWINENIPAGATIAIRYPPSIWDCVPFHFYRYQLTDYRNFHEHAQRSIPDAAVLINVPLPEPLKPHLHLAREYLPWTVFGYHFELGGELHALIGKTIRIYTRKPLPSSP